MQFIRYANFLYRLHFSEKWQFRILTLYAKIKGVWIKDIQSITDRFLAKGRESYVYLSGGTKVVKNKEIRGWQNFCYAFVCLMSANECFPNVASKLIELNKRGIIYEQPFINGRFATEQEITSYLKAHNFRKEKVYYTDGDFNLRDLKPANVLYMNGELYFIDAWVTPNPEIKNEKIKKVLQKLCVV